MQGRERTGHFITMTRGRHLLAVILGPGLVSGLAVAAQAAFQAFLLGDCDMKLGCASGVQFTAALAGLSFLLSSLGLVVPAMLFRSMIGTLPAGGRWGIVAVLAVLLWVILPVVGYWPFEPFIPAFIAWAATSALLGFAVLLVARGLLHARTPSPTPEAPR